MKRRSNRLLQFVFILTLVVCLILATNVFLVSIVKVHLRSGTNLSQYADSANTRTTVIKAMRGYVYDRDGDIIAQDILTYNIVCILDSSRPSVGNSVAYVADPTYTAQVLSTILNADKDYIYSQLTKNVYQTELGTIGRNLSKETKEEIESYNLPGIEFTSSIKRSYPLGVFAPYLIGFAQSDETGSTVGKMGVELYLDNYLKGTDGHRIYQADKNGYILPGMKEDYASAVNGYDVYLTLDKDVQETLEQCFQTTEAQFNADRIWGAVMEINTGKIVAWGQYPSFDPNTLDITDYNNYGAQLPYEPGSTFKSFAWAAAINEGTYDSSMEVYGGPYCYSAQNRVPYRVDSKGLGCITNAGNKNYGWVSYDYGLIYSSNAIASSVITDLIDPDTYLKYVKAFGFFSPVNTDGMREETGFLNFNWPSDKLALSYGQGSTATMLQMLQAYSALFSDGTMKKPYYVEKIVDPYDSSNVIYQAQTQITGNPITAETAAKVREILYRVVNDDDGTAKYYRIPETDIIGKTGTTQLAVSGTYKSGKTIVSLMAALPADNPQYIVYYCFQADYNRNAHFHSEAITTLLRKVAMQYGFTDNLQVSVPVLDEDGNETYVQKDIVTYDMTNLTNHSVQYAQNQLSSMDVDVVVIGEGDTVIDQYPSSDSTVSTGGKVFLLTDANQFFLEDMTGWARKDVAAYWSITGLGFKITGYGKVIDQNVPSGSLVGPGYDIEVTLSEE